LPARWDGSGPAAWQVGVSVGGFATTVVLDGADVDVEQRAVTATLGRSLSTKMRGMVSAGAIVGGTVEGRDVTGGATLSATLAWLPVFERSRRPFVGVTATLGGAWARATADDGMQRSWTAFDLRGGAMVGKTLAGRWVPYVAARAFGGPVFWRRGGAGVVGGDRYHVTAGAGLTVRLPRGVDATLELMPLGEQSAAAGAALRW